MSCGVGCRRGSDPTLLWFWRRLIATVPIGPLAWEPPHAAGTALKTPPPKRNYLLLEFPGGLVVKDSALSLLWRGFSPWPGNFCRPPAQPKKPPCPFIFGVPPLPRLQPLALEFVTRDAFGLQYHGHSWGCKWRVTPFMWLHKPGAEKGARHPGSSGTC